MNEHGRRVLRRWRRRSCGQRFACGGWIDQRFLRLVALADLVSVGRRGAS